jgi:hypothetical protein
MTLKSEHTSRLKGRPVPKPKNMASIKMPPEVRQAMEEAALDIFTDMTNAGATLQQTLGAIYLSGIEHAISAMKEKQDVQNA